MADPRASNGVEVITKSQAVPRYEGAEQYAELVDGADAIEGLVPQLQTPCRAAAIPDMAAIARAQRGRKLIPSYCASLDALLRGGFETGCLVAIGGMPGVTKTGFALATGYEMARRGVDTYAGHKRILVAVVAGDERRRGFLTRFGQMQGVRRDELDDEDPSVHEPAWQRVADAFARTPDLLIFSPRTVREPSTVEDIAHVALDAAFERDARLVLIVDSIHSAPFACDESDGEKNEREQIQGRIRWLRDFTETEDALAIYLSELNRGGYGQGRQAEMSSFKGTRRSSTRRISR